MLKRKSSIDWKGRKKTKVEKDTTKTAVESDDDSIDEKPKNDIKEKVLTSDEESDSSLNDDDDNHDEIINTIRRNVAKLKDKFENEESDSNEDDDDEEENNYCEDDDDDDDDDGDEDDDDQIVNKIRGNLTVIKDEMENKSSGDDDDEENGDDSDYSEQDDLDDKLKRKLDVREGKSDDSETEDDNDSENNINDSESDEEEMIPSKKRNINSKMENNSGKQKKQKGDINSKIADDRFSTHVKANFDENDSEDPDVGQADEYLMEEEEETIGTDSVMPEHKPLDVAEEKKYFKPPTNEELNRIRETNNLFHSTLFRLQISEILHEVKVKTKKMKAIDNAVEILKNKLTAMESVEKNDIDDSGWLKKYKIKPPLLDLPKTAKMPFNFLPPVAVTTSGSYAQGTCVRQNMDVDVNVVMPKACFGHKDHINHCYLKKRSLYLCKIATTLIKDPHVADVKFTYHHGNQYKPVLVCVVTVNETQTVKVYLHAVPESGTFTLNKFHVSKNNVRSGWFQGDGNANISPENDVPTPFYNCTILEDMLTTENSLTKRLENCSSSVKEGILLLKIWLRQRELEKGFGCFGGYIMSMYVMYLLSKRKLNHQMSSYQIMRNTLLHLKDCDWTTDGITLCNSNDSAIPLITEFHKHFDIVFVDQSGFHNICYSMNFSTFNRVRNEASLAMSLLEDKSIDSFDKLFMKKVPFYHKFDHIFHVHESSSFEACVDKFGLRSSRYMDYGRCSSHACVSSILQVLQKGLGKRVTLIQSCLEQPREWDVTIGSPQSEDKLTFGVMLDSEFAFNVLDRGPSADKAEAGEFSKFWGEKSELRRFHDGGICEAVLWTKSKKTSVKEMVCRQIVKYILEFHCGIKTSLGNQTVQYFGDQLNCVLSSVVTSDENAFNLMRTYNDMCKILRRLDDLPLVIMSIQGVSPCFRYTEVFPPAPSTFKQKLKKCTNDKIQRLVPTESNTCPVYLQALKVVCTMEASGKWPDDLQAMKRLKVAILIQLGQLIDSQFNLPTKVTTTHVDVLKDNYVFRIVLAYDKEVNLLKTIKTGDGLVRKRDSPEALVLEKEIIGLPKLSSSLYGTHLNHSSFSSTARLAKRWISCHMLGDYIQPEAVELIVAYLYLNPAPYTPPKSGFVGFQRFLELLSTFDWKINPLFVNINNEFTDEDIHEISTRFTNERSDLPLMFISTPEDKMSSHWTATSPTAPILNRLVVLAQKSLDIIHVQISSHTSVDLKCIFRPPLEVYDVLIELNPDYIAQPYHQLDMSDHVRQTLIPIQSTSNSKTQDWFPVTDFNPVRLFIKEIKESFDDVCMLFYDDYGGSVIGLVWKPDASNTKEFKIMDMHHTMLRMKTGNKPSVVQNIDSIIEDIRLMGGELIENIKFKNQ